MAENPLITIKRNTFVGIAAFIIIVIGFLFLVIKDNNNGKIYLCTCTPSIGGANVKWRSSPAGKEAQCMSEWIEKGGVPTKCPGQP